MLGAGEGVWEVAQAVECPMTLRKSCRHLGCLSSRRIASSTFAAQSTAWLCLTCLREWESKTTFTQHGRSKNHPLSWVIPESQIFCVICSSFVDLEVLDVKKRAAVDVCISSIKSLLDASPSMHPSEPLELSEPPEPQESSPHKDAPKTLEINHKPPGLHNLGNTCFMNATLQSLAALDTFVVRAEDDKLQSGLLTSALLDLLQAMRSLVKTPTKHSSTNGQSDAIGGKRFGTAISPSRFFDQLSKKYSFFERNEQQDSHDFLRLLFNALDDEHEAHNPENKDYCDPQHRKVFGLTISNKIECRTCKSCVVRKEPNLDISLAVKTPSLPQTLHALSLDEAEDAATAVADDGDNDHDFGALDLRRLFDLFVQPQKLEDENSFACESCFKNSNSNQDAKIENGRNFVYSPAICQYSLSTLPQALIIHLQRFSTTRCGSVGGRKRSSFGYGKNHANVRLPPTLNLERWQRGGHGSTYDFSPLDSTYRLKAMVIHEGTTADFGHYVAIVCREGSWFRISDTSVYPISTSAALSTCDAYLIFYEKIDS